MAAKVNLGAPMLTPVAGLVAGILAAGVGAGFVTGALLIVAGIIIYEVLRRFTANPVYAWRLRQWHHSWLFLIFAGAGVMVTDFSRPVPLNDALTGSTRMAYGRIRDLSDRTAGDRIIVDVNALVDSAGNVRACSPEGVTATIAHCEAVPGDYIGLPCRLIPLAASPYSFDDAYPQRMQRKGILYEADMEEEAFPDYDAEKEKKPEHRLQTWLWNLRIDMERFVECTSLSMPVKKFLITLLLGDKAYLDSDTRDLFADAGISHVLALSGMHVSIVAGILLFLLYPFNFFGLYKWRYLIALPVLWGYTAITGASPATVRAAIMMTVLVASLLLERRNSGWNALLSAMFVILLFSPMSLYDAGLQLSFICVASLILFAGPVNPIDHRAHPRLHAVAAAVSVSIVATAGSWVITAYWFGAIPLLFLPANILVLPLLPVYIVVALIYFLSVLAGMELHPLAWLLDGSYEGLTRLLEWLRGDSGTSVEVTVSLITVLLWLAAMGVAAVWLHHRRTRLNRGMAILLATAALVTVPMAAAERHTEVIVTNSRRNVTVRVKSGRDFREYRFPANTVGEYAVDGIRIVSADCSVEGAAVQPGCDVLVVTSRCPDSIAWLMGRLRPAHVMTYPTDRILRLPTRDP